MERQAKTIKHLFFAAAALCLVYAAVRSPRDDAQAMAKVVMLDVGQGDSFLVQAANGAQLLIDGGKDDKVLAELAKAMPRGDRSIDVIIATHPDADHIGGLPLVFDRYDVGLFLTSKVVTDTETFGSLYRAIADEGSPAYYARTGMTISLDDAPSTAFSILFPDRSTTEWETNAASVVGRLNVGERSALFTGDSPQSIETYLASADPKDIDVDILKLGHHGSKTSSGEAFLRAASPALALVSAGVNNRYGHPAPEVTDRLRALGIPFVSTQDTGTYTLSTDGVKWYTK